MRFGFHSAVSVAVHLTSFFFLFKNFSLGEDPYVYFDWRTSYITASPLGVLQQRNCRSGIQQRKNSWQDGVSGTNCPIPAGWNWTSEFQVKDQIGSFFYFPSLNFQSASGRYGGITINNRPIITLPFGTPDGDITLLISDWYTRSHKYNEALLPQNDEYLAVNVEPEIDRNENALPENAIYCVLLSYLQKDQSRKVKFTGVNHLARTGRAMVFAFPMTLLTFLF